MKLIFAFFFIFLSIQANACDCDSIKGLKDAAVAFRGTVVKVQRIEYPYIHYEITFQIDKWQKGADKKKIIVINTPCLSEICCGIPFQIGEAYIVYAYEEEKQLNTNLCWATEKIK
ncbi:MAG: hypothetical protein JNK27_15020 [Chitinophagaceae bacterium]|nr:hypothetical protein [Chitinophagaceae bacterium]